MPTDRRNLVWKAASLLHRVATGKPAAPRDIAIDLRKRIPSEAGLGGGSADAADDAAGAQQAVEARSRSRDAERGSARGSAPTCRSSWSAAPRSASGAATTSIRWPTCRPVHVVILRPGFGVVDRSMPTAGSTRSRGAPRRSRRRAPMPPGWPAWAATLRNDLEAPVVRHHPGDRPHPPVAGRRRGRVCRDVGVRIGGVRPVRARRRRAPNGQRPGPARLAVAAHPDAEPPRIRPRGLPLGL